MDLENILQLAKRLRNAQSNLQQAEGYVDEAQSRLDDLKQRLVDCQIAEASVRQELENAIKAAKE